MGIQEDDEITNVNIEEEEIDIIDLTVDEDILNDIIDLTIESDKGKRNEIIDLTDELDEPHMSINDFCKRYFTDCPKTTQLDTWWHSAKSYLDTFKLQENQGYLKAPTIKVLNVFQTRRLTNRLPVTPGTPGRLLKGCLELNSK